MAIGAREEPILGHWLVPIRGVVQGVDDIAIPPNGLYDGFNVEVIDGTLRGRRGLVPQPIISNVKVFGARPLGALNFWQTESAAWIVTATTNKVWALELATNALTDLGGNLVAGPDDATRITQFSFGTPVVNRVYVCNGLDPLKSWKPGDASVSNVRLTKNDTVTFSPVNVGNGVFAALPTLGASVQLGTYFLVCINTTVPAIFSVTAPDLTVLPNLTVGVAYPGAHFNGTLNAGTVAWALQDTVKINVTDSAPIFKDITVSNDRLLGLVGSHGIRWGEPLDDQTWPALNQRLLTETPAPTIAIRILGTVGVVAYKKDSVWLGETTGAAGAFAFKWGPLFWMEGPAGPNAVVDTGGKHVYMTPNGRVAVFTGSAHKWVADGAWPIVKAEIDTAAPKRIHGVYLRQQEQVWFSYKRRGVADTDGLLVVQLERPETDKPYAAFPGRWSKSITASCSIWADTYNTNMVFAANSGAEKAYQVDGLGDDGALVSSFIQTGLTVGQHKALPGTSGPFRFIPLYESLRVLAIEPFVERRGGYGFLTVKAVTSNVLDDMAGTLSQGALVNLSNVPISTPVGVDARGRYLGVRLEWDSTATVKYRGVVVRAPNLAPDQPKPRAGQV